jgi:hypothetical protein
LKDHTREKSSEHNKGRHIERIRYDVCLKVLRGYPY